ncbi:hypothetical protein HK105_202005 [Polyrhizophydium stewartii]|uniref:HTH APSES-type domain-containing protein n=1 Tax=Polyrhizophydium stewartii TaxID=2732419 RepID=A0ABR4NGK6_9FUNG
MTILADPFALSAFGAVLSAVDWPRLSSPKHVADALLDHDPSGDQAPQTARQTAESIILVGLLLMLHSGAAPDLAASDRKRLLDAIQSERITFQNLPVIKHTSLPAGTWKQAFATRSVRLQSQPGAMPEWTLAVNVALDAVRIRFCREVGFFDPASVGSAAAQGSPVAKMLGQALAASYFTVFDYATLNQAMFSANLELLAVYAGELPATWLGASFAQILVGAVQAHLEGGAPEARACAAAALRLLRSRAQKCSPDSLDTAVASLIDKCVNIYVKSEQQDLLQLSLLCLVAIAARSVAPIEPTTIETLAKGISNTPVTQECMQGIVQLAPKLSDDSLGVLVRALVNPPAGSAPPSGLEVTSSLSSSSANHGSQLSSGTSLLARQSMDELVNIARLFAALGSDRGAAFDKELEKLGAAHRSWRKYLGLQPRVAATWVPKLLALVIDLSEPSGDAFAPFPDIPCPSMSAQQAFAVLGVLEALVLRRSKKLRSPTSWIARLANWLLASAHRIGGGESTEAAFVFARAANALPRPPEQGVELPLGDVVDAKVLVLGALDALLHHPDGLGLPEWILGDPKEARTATCAEIQAYLEQGAAARGRTPIGANIGALTHAVARGVVHLSAIGDTDAVEQVVERLHAFASKLFLQWSRSMFSFDAAEPVPENRKALIDGLFKHLQRTLLAVVTILGNIGFLVLADLENVIQHGTQLPQATLELSSRAIEVFSCLHFITSQYGLEGFDQWTRWMAVFCSAVARVPGASEALALRCLPGPPLAGPELKRARVLFFLLLASRLLRSLPTELLAEQVFPLARPYAAMAHEKAADADWKPDVDTLDAFDASHSLHLKLFECSSLHRALACSMAPAYVGTLLNLFPKRVDAEMLGLCFGTVIKAFGQVFFSGAIEPSALILGRSHQRHALGDAQTPGGEPAASEANTSDVVLRAADVAASDHAAASEERVASGWEGLDLEARKVAQACIDLLLQRIHDLSEHSGPAARGAGGSIQASPSPLSEGAAATLVPKLSDAAKRARVADILAASEAVSRVVLHDQLLMVLFEQLNTVSLLLLPDLMAEIADLLIGNDARGIAGCGLTKAHSPLWQALFKAVSEDGRVDYTRRLHLVEWYMDLHATATSLIASRPARSPSERAASDTQPPAGLPRLQAKL